MDTLQDFLTLAATVMEYFFFAYLAGAFIVYSLKSPGTAKPLRSASVPSKAWERSVDSKPSTSIAAIAG